MSAAGERCDGCAACAMRCTAGIRMTAAEYQCIVEALGALPRRLAWRVLQQEKQRPWCEEATYTACLFLDIETERCLIYPARPLICRLFGRITHLPCPIAAIPTDLGASPEVLIAYTQQPLATFQEWMMANGCFDLTDVLADADAPCYEL